ncbi:MAG: hypothetical protein ACRCST_07270 [Turicibacter sp.]
MTRFTKIILLIISLLFILIVLFIANAKQTHFNARVLSELGGDIIYLRRDEDLVLKLYKSQANLENEMLIYEHSALENSNIIGFSYDEVTDLITFGAFDDIDQNFETYEISIDGGVVKPLNIPYETKELPSNHQLTGSLNESNFEIISENGSMYLLSDTEKLSLKNYKGFYDGKFSSGYQPITLSQDSNYLFYSYTPHMTPIGTILDGMFLNHEPIRTYIMDLQSQEYSEYVNFYGDIVWIN